MSPQTPCLIITRNLQPAAALVRAARAARVPIFGTALPTTASSAAWAIGWTMPWLPAKRCTVYWSTSSHRRSITGPSGIGKSETALELIQKGIASLPTMPWKSAGLPKISWWNLSAALANLLELRGVGIIDVTKLFGAGALARQTGGTDYSPAALARGEPTIRLGL